MEELVDFIEELERNCNKEREELKANAYGVGLESNYAIHLRDKFNVNDGKYEIIKRIKSKILEVCKNKN